MEAMIARCYGFKHIEYLRWIGTNVLRMGILRADGQECIVRACGDDTSATYQTELVCWLETASINVESIIRTLFIN